MASAISHAAVGLAIGACFDREKVPVRALLLGAALAIAPDLDAIGFWLGVSRGSLFGHRGITHSLAFALVTGLLAARLFTSRADPPGQRGWLSACFVLVLASHGLLDALTNGGSGVAFFSPFDTGRYFFPFRPIEVSPIGIDVFNARGLRILGSEVRWVLLPAALLAGIGVALRRRSAP